MTKQSDHISLTLPSSIVGAEETSTTGLRATRRSLHRSWNQLPRCQRNLILLAIVAIYITLLLLLPGDPTENGKTLSSSKLLPFHGNREGASAVASHHRPNYEEDLLSKNVLSDVDDGSQFKELNLPQLQAPIASVDNELKITEFQKLNPAQEAVDSSNKFNTQLLNNVHSNNIEAPAALAGPNEAELQMIDLESAVKDPDRLPGHPELTIADIAKRLESSAAAQKQHFHGATNERQSAVVAAFKHSWAGYKKFSWGHDNLKPISQSSYDWFGLGLTIVDSLDTMYIMGLEDEFTEARDWVRDSLSFDTNRDVNLFEVTIRVLGGLLSAFHLSGDTVFLKKSIELGNRLLPCFQSPSGIPYSDVNLGSMAAHSPKWSPDSSTSEVTTIQLEFRDLTRTTNVSIYEKVVHTVNEKVHALKKTNGLVPIFISANTGTFRTYATISLGARGDSYYEYLLKQWIQTGQKEDDFLILDYMAAIDGVLTQLMRRTPKEQHVYIGELINGKDFKPKMDHLTCYLPGTLILGHKYGMPDSHILLAKDLLETCFQTYMKQPTHLAPEISYFALNANEEHEIYVKPNDAHNLLRPEFIESLYYFYAITGNRTYQDMGWEIFQAFEKHTKVAYGYTSIGNVKNVLNTRLRDMMESFWLSETLKYFYLLFSDNRNEIDLDKWVFNTEAHPLPIRNH